MTTKIPGSMIDTDTVTASNIAAGAVGASEIGTDAVAADEIAAGAVGASELASTLDLSGKTLTMPANGSRAGEVVQIVNTTVVTSSTGTTAIPLDDTIPQNTEGDQVMSLAITPKATGNKLKIDVLVNASHSAVNAWAIALFQDSTAGALAVSCVNTVAAGPSSGTLTHYMDAGTTSATTFKVRIGASTGATMTFNGNGGARKYGGVLSSSITITEIKV